MDNLQQFFLRISWNWFYSAFAGESKRSKTLKIPQILSISYLFRFWCKKSFGIWTIRWFFSWLQTQGLSVLFLWQNLRGLLSRVQILIALALEIQFEQGCKPWWFCVLMFLYWGGGHRSKEEASHPAATGSNSGSAKIFSLYFLVGGQYWDRTHLVLGNGFHKCS